MLKWLLNWKDKAKEQDEEQKPKEMDRYKNLLDGGSITEILDAFDDK